MEGFTITIEAAGDGSLDAEALDEFAELLQPWGGAVSAGQDAGRYGATFSDEDEVDGRIETACEWGLHTFREMAEKAGLPRWPVVRLEVMTFAEQDADLARPAVPELVGTSEIAELLDVTRQRAHRLAQTREDFPEPVARLASGPVWTRRSLDWFLKGWERMVGRPPSDPVLFITADPELVKQLEPGTVRDGYVITAVREMAETPGAPSPQWSVRGHLASLASETLEPPPRSV